MPPSCGLYTTVNASGTPDSPYLCDRVFSPNMRYSLVLGLDRSLAVYDYGTGAGDSWTLVTTIMPSDSWLLGKDLELFLEAGGFWYLNPNKSFPFTSSVDYGNTLLAHRGDHKAPFRLTVGNDGNVQLMNNQGQAAWTS